MQVIRDAASGARRRWWLLAAVLVVGFVVLTKDKPQWYAEETAVMDQVADLLKSPVAYERNGEGWFGAQHVSRVVLPRVQLDEETTGRLAILLRSLPPYTHIVCYYIQDQEDRVEQLVRELGNYSVSIDPGASSQSIEELQERTYVAGIHRPGVPPFPRPEERNSHLHFHRHLEAARFHWATNTALDLQELNQLAEQASALTYRWLQVPDDGTSKLRIYLCADLAELRAVENEFGVVGSAFQVRRNVGGYYPDGKFVAVIASAHEAAEYAVHEVVHAVVDRVVSPCPDPLNEGAAMLLTEQVLGENARYRAWIAEQEAARRRICAAVDVEKASLESLFSLDYFAFRETRDSRNYWLSLELVRVLDRENDARFPGALQRLVKALRGRWGADAFPVFTDVYPLREVEALWKEQLRLAARGVAPR